MSDLGPASPAGGVTSLAVEVEERERFELCCTQIQRFDALRSTVAVRASVIMSANAVLLAGATLIADRYAAGRPGLIFGVVATVLPALASLLWCLPALASTKQDRALFGTDLDRGVFDWQGTIRDFPAEPGCLDMFVERFTRAPLEHLLEDASRELWVCIHQHARRYRAMRMAIVWLRVSVVAFVGFLLVAIAVVNS